MLLGSGRTRSAKERRCFLPNKGSHGLNLRSQIDIAVQNRTKMSRRRWGRGFVQQYSFSH